MKVTVESAAACRKVLKIEVPADQVGEQFKEVIRGLSRVAQVPGFRPGHAPVSMIEKRFAKEIVEEVRDRLVPKAYKFAIDQEKLVPVAVVDVKPGEPLHGLPFSVEIAVDVAPEFTVPDYKGKLSVKPAPVLVTEEQIDEGVRDLQRRGATIEEIKDRGAQKDDFVQIDYDGTCDEKSIAEVAGDKAANLGAGKDFWTMLGEQEFLPGLSAALEGIKPGDTRTVSIVFPQPFRVEALAGKKCSYTLTAKQIRARKLAAIDADFLKTMGVESGEALRARVKESLNAIAEIGEKRRVRGETLKWLLEQADLKDLPEAVVAEETNRTLHEIVRENIQRGVSQDELAGHKDELYDTAVKTSSDRVRLDFILTRIANEEKLVVTDDEVEAEISRMAARYGSTPAKLHEDIVKRDALGRMRDDLRVEKAIEMLVTLAQKEG